jgi:hypothetical protein
MVNTRKRIHNVRRTKNKKYKRVNNTKCRKGGATNLNQAKSTAIINSTSLLNTIAMGILVSPNTLLKSLLFMVTVPFEILNSNLTLLREKHAIHQSTLSGIFKSYGESITQTSPESIEMLHRQYVSFINMCVEEDNVSIPSLCEQILQLIKGDYISTKNILYSIQCKKSLISSFTKAIRSFINRKDDYIYKNDINCPSTKLTRKESLYKKVIMLKYEGMINSYNVNTSRLKQYETEIKTLGISALSEITKSFPNNLSYYERCNKFLSDVEKLKTNIINCSPYNNEIHIKLSNDLASYIKKLYDIKEEQIEAEIKSIGESSEMKEVEAEIKKEVNKNEKELEIAKEKAKSTKPVSEKNLFNFVESQSSEQVKNNV